MVFSGKLVLVVGPSGAGKDTLIDAARVQLHEDKRFIFPRRIVTRDAVADVEDHDTITRQQFDLMRAEGDFALSWEAHDLGYIIPRQIEAALANKQTVVCNTSRRVITDAAEKYPGTHVLVVTANAALRAQRLAGRGRETKAEIDARLAREAIQLPTGVPTTKIDNSGALSSGIAATIAALIDITDHRNAAVR